jgi:hypothetical protein
MNNPEIININESQDTEPIPLKERNTFQAKLMRKMFGGDLKNKTPQEKVETELDWASLYAKRVSDIIDHAEYQDIRDLIMSGKYEEAMELIIPIITTDELVRKEA